MDFSERIGAVQRTIQLGSMSERLRNRLWSVAYRRYWLHQSSFDQLTRTPHEGQLLILLGRDFFGIPEDEVERILSYAVGQIKTQAFGLGWARFYDFVEFIANHAQYHADFFVIECNEVLKQELSGYRFVGTELAPITNTEEMAAVEK